MYRYSNIGQIEFQPAFRRTPSGRAARTFESAPVINPLTQMPTTPADTAIIGDNVYYISQPMGSVMAMRVLNKDNNFIYGIPAILINRTNQTPIFPPLTISNLSASTRYAELQKFISMVVNNSLAIRGPGISRLPRARVVYADRSNITGL